MIAEQDDRDAHGGIAIVDDAALRTPLPRCPAVVACCQSVAAMWTELISHCFDGSMSFFVGLRRVSAICEFHHVGGYLPEKAT